MINKKYYISKGNNLGQNHFLFKDDSLNNFFYQGTIQNIYNDAEIIWEALRTTNYYTILQQSKEFKEWECSKEAENASRIEYLNKVLSFMPKEILDKVEMYKNNKKQQFESVFSKIEGLYKNSINTQDVSPIKFDEDFALLEDRKVLLHNIPLPTSMEEVEGRKDLGFLASEWFGKLEHKGEDRFCASFIKAKGLSPKTEKSNNQPKFDIDGNEIKPAPQLTFIFDAESEDLKPLLRLDLFQYCRNKQSDKLDKYKDEEIEILETLLQWSSGAKNIANKEQTWSAIPGGVSSKYVIGVIANNIKDNSQDMEIAMQVSEKFGVPLLRPDLTAIVGTEVSM